MTRKEYDSFLIAVSDIHPAQALLLNTQRKEIVMKKKEPPLRPTTPARHSNGGLCNFIYPSHNGDGPRRCGERCMLHGPNDHASCGGCRCATHVLSDQHLHPNYGYCTHQDTEGHLCQQKCALHGKEAHKKCHGCKCKKHRRPYMFPKKETTKKRPLKKKH